VHLDNCPESIFSWFGCAVAGASAVTTNARSVADELTYYAENAEIVGAITQPRFADLVEGSTKPNFLIVTETDNGAAPAPGDAPSPADSFDRLFEAAPLDLRPPDPHLNFSVQFTSGTTSRPKGVVWNHANALWGARMCARNEHLRADDVHLTHLRAPDASAVVPHECTGVLGAGVAMGRGHGGRTAAILSITLLGCLVAQSLYVVIHRAILRQGTDRPR